ncbi:hypothetical protein HMPREF9225_0104 [Peptoniphilus duerdenii ATCC BAA-1640]|uniref:Uncharacterized protein n=2 Tax=Peptoniphilus TaxID=162289 RepID=E0NIW5_9FIRM|nr:hypothetical protein HMPREF9225_0104 [Peptoniphilus duerdenii ATCC BAA-1640]
MLIASRFFYKGDRMLNLFTVDSKFLNYLRTFDDKVLFNHGIDRPYVGIILSLSTADSSINYFAPLSSPKRKHITMKNNIDFIKIDSGNLGAINLNNMIPLVNNTYFKIDINSVKDKNYQILLSKQIRWIRSNKLNITSKAYSLYRKMTQDDSSLNSFELKVKSRCCDFSLLEDVANRYMK